MSKFSTFFPLACCLLIAGCGRPASVPPVIEKVANAERLPDGTYEILLRYSVTSSGGPCFNKDWFKAWTSYSTNWLYVNSLEGVQSADEIVVTTDAAKREWPYAHTNMHGSVSFTNTSMIVRLQQPDVDSKGIEMSTYVPYYLDGVYQITERSK